MFDFNRKSVADLGITFRQTSSVTQRATWRHEGFWNKIHKSWWTWLAVYAKRVLGSGVLWPLEIGDSGILSGLNNSVFPANNAVTVMLTWKGYAKERPCRNRLARPIHVVIHFVNWHCCYNSCPGKPYKFVFLYEISPGSALRLNANGGKLCMSNFV